MSDYPLTCPRLNVSRDPSLNELNTLFGSGVSYSFARTWKKEVDPDFETGTVQLGWEPSTQSLHVFCRMQDRELCSPEPMPNNPAFMSGDTFEIFLKPQNEDVYHELHVGPLGQMMQLRFPSEKVFRRKRTESKGFLCDFLVERTLLSRKSWIRPESAEWVVYAVVLLPSLLEGRSVASGDRWQFSFCRYNHYWDKRSPVFSSTSPFTVPDFHRLAEWPEFELG